MSLRQLRGERLLSLRELARQSGVSKNAIAHIERAAPAQLRYATIRALSAALGVAPAEVAEFRPSLGLPADEG